MLTLTVFDPTSRTKTRQESFPSNIASGCANPLPGASAVHLHLTHDNDADCLRIEVDATPDFPVDFNIAWIAAENRFKIDVGRNRPYFMLPPEAIPMEPIIPARCGKLDFVVVVDATAAALKGTGEIWKIQAEQACAMVQTLRASYPDLRFGLVSFSDEPMGDLADAADLTPSSPSSVKGGTFASFSQAQIQILLNSVSYSSGGDYVDALGDALDHCVTRIQWRPNGRKILLIIGDSPGHSLMYPLHESADTRPRRADVDEKAAGLHDLGVEIATVCSAPEQLESEQALPDHEERQLRKALRTETRAQYQRLASLAQWAFLADDFDPQRAAEALLANGIPAIGRIAAYPMLATAPADPGASSPETTVLESSSQ